jgi:hypothetical protein
MSLPNEYYCAIFNFASGLQRVNMLSDTDTACVVIILTLYLKKWGKIAAGSNSGTNEGP